MRLLIATSLSILSLFVSAQQMIVPGTILSNSRTNFHTLHYFNTSLGDNGVKLLLHADLFSIRYPCIKLSIESYRHDYFSNLENIETIRLKANYVFRISRRMSFTLAGSGGTYTRGHSDLIYSGGVAISSRKLSASYHLFGQGSELAHTFQFHLAPVYRLNKEAKYSKRSEISIKGAYTLNSQLEFPYCSNYLQVNLGLKDLNIGLGIHESRGSIQPNASITLKNIGYFDFCTTLFLNKKSMPDLQVTIVFKKTRFKPRFINISMPDF